MVLFSSSLLLLLLPSLLLLALAFTPQEEIQDLFDLFLSTRGERWSWRIEALAGPEWDFTVVNNAFLRNPCSHSNEAWQGVECSSTPESCALALVECHVTGLNLRDYNLRGTLPNMSSLTSLTLLLLSENHIMGTIPTAFGQLSYLESLDLYENTMIGSIPEEIYQLENLQLLWLANNLLTGTISRSIGGLSSLTYLYLTRNFLHGEIPSEISRLSSLRFLEMSDNLLGGSLPSALGTIETLATIYLNSNSLTGVIPSELANATTLQFFEAEYNFFSRTIPSALGRLSFITLVLHGNDLEGTIPPSLGDYSSLRNLWLSSNRLTGSVSAELFSTTVEVFDLSDNQLTGSIPTEFNLATSLRTLRLQANQLSGNIPTYFARLDNLVYFEVNDNRLVGGIPEKLGGVTSIKTLRLSQNFLTGTIPAALCNLANLRWLWLFDNSFSGRIPSCLGNLSNVEYLELDGNVLTGSVPEELGKVSTLEELFLMGNFLSGSLPTSLSTLVNLRVVELSNNLLIGSVPSGYGSISYLEELYLGDNVLSGAMPNDLGKLGNLAVLEVSNNLFIGSIPETFGGLENLTVMSLQGNMLDGNLHNVFNPARQGLLEMIDVSNNLLSGFLPDDVFSFLSVHTMVLSVNCFTGHIPLSVCQASMMRVLSMDGLGGSKNCPDTFHMPLSGIALFNYMEGSIPSCLWKLENLTYLHISGNGLTGTIGTPPPTTDLRDVSLSHNQLGGTIPNVIRNMSTLDLSYNKLTGHFHGHPGSTSKRLAVNRLSGDVHGDELVDIPYVAILRDNIFQCDSIPENDEYFPFYVCGSLDFDYAILLLGFAFLLWVGAFVTMSLLPKLDKFKPFQVLHLLRSKLSTVRFYLNFFSSANSENVEESRATLMIREFVEGLLLTCSVSVKLCLLIVAATMPAYFLRIHEHVLEEHEKPYSTYAVLYRWFFTLAHFTGRAPALLVMCAWITVMCSYFTFVKVYFPDDKGDASSLKPGIRKRLSSVSQRSVAGIALESGVSRWKLVGLLFLNIIITFSVNASYIISTEQNYAPGTHFAIQALTALFKLVYMLVCLPLLASAIEEPYLNIWFRLRVIILNSLIVPMLAIAVRSPACLEGLFFEADEIVSEYSMELCKTYISSSLFNLKSCVNFTETDVLIAPLVPPFTYSYECSSGIITAYAPVFTYIYALQLFIPILYGVLAVSISYESIPKALRLVFHAIMWPEYSIKPPELQLDPTLLFDTRDIITTDILNNLVVLFTFGICSPILTFAIGCSMCLKLKMWTFLVGRFCNALQPKKSLRLSAQLAEGDDHNEKEFSNKNFSSEDKLLGIENLSNACIPINLIFHLTMWPLIWCSTVFFSFVCWEMYSDEAGWRSASWVPLVTLALPLVLWSVRFFHVDDSSNLTARPSEDKCSSRHQDLEMRDIGGISDSSVKNPVHMT